MCGCVVYFSRLVCSFNAAEEFTSTELRRFLKFLQI